MKNIKNQNRCPEMDIYTPSTNTTDSHYKSEEIGSNFRKEFGNSSNCVFFNEERGFPTKCVCGSDVSIYTSLSNPNPGRPYFRCSVSRMDGHLFKWVEDGMYEEVKDLIQNFGGREFDIGNGTRIEVNELMLEIQNVKEEVLHCKTELRKIKIKNMVVIGLCFCVFAFVIYKMFHKVDGNTLVFGNK